MRALFLLLTIFISLTISSQTQLTKEEVKDLPNTVENQFTKIYRLSNNWQEYKMIKRTYFVSFQKNILDSVSNFKSDILNKEQKITEQQKVIASLNQKIVDLEKNLSESISKEDNISLFGMQLSKIAYNSLLWSIIAGLIAGLAFFILKFKNSNILTRKAKSNLVEVEEEFEKHRKKALEREQKLRRQLQDEINKQRGV